MNFFARHRVEENTLETVPYCVIKSDKRSQDRSLILSGDVTSLEPNF